MQQYYSKYINEKNHKRAFSNCLYMIILILIFLMAMDYKTRMYYIAIIAFCVSLLYQYKCYSFHPIVIPAVILTLSLALFSSGIGTDINSIIRIFVYPICVLIGYNIVNTETKTTAEKSAILIIISLATGAYVHFLLNLFININTYSSRNGLDFWTLSKLSATGHSSMACMMIGVAISGLFTKTKRLTKCLCICSLLSIVYYNLILSGRTTFIMIVSIIFINILFFLLTQRKKGEKSRLFIIFILFFCILFLCIQINLFGITDIIEKSNFYMRFFGNNSVEGIGEDHRLLYKTLYFQNLLNYPFGGNELRKAIGGAYAHDVLLDTYSIAGFSAAGAVLVLIIFSIKRCIRFIFFHEINRDLAVMIFNFLISVFFIFSLEPILEGMPWLFMSFCIVCGMMARLSKI